MDTSKLATSHISRSLFLNILYSTFSSSHISKWQALGCCDRLSVPQCAKLLKCVKSLSYESAVLSSLQAAGALKTCVMVLRKEWEVSQQALPILYNLCRLVRTRILPNMVI